MSGALSTVDVVGIVGPIVFYVVSLVVYYVWEGKREQRINEQYEEVTGDGR
ncbi:MAG: hypothetical protein ABEH83_01160 [Halobacterium sp.]